MNQCQSVQWKCHKGFVVIAQVYRLQDATNPPFTVSPRTAKRAILESIHFAPPGDSPCVSAVASLRATATLRSKKFERSYNG